MTGQTMKLLSAYITLLLGLAVLGGYNQGLYKQQATLIDQKAKLQAQIRGLRAEAAPINGPLAISNWAKAQGMVSASQALNTRTVAPGPGPSIKHETGSVGVITIWR